MPTVKIEYFGAEGTGANVTEAKRDAGRQIDRVMRNRAPRVYRHRGATLIISTEAQGISSFIVWPDTRDGRVQSGCTFSADDDEANALLHLISSMRQPGETTPPDWTPADILRKHGAEWKRRWEADDIFQARYREAEARDMNSADAHAYACGRIELQAA